MDIKSNSTQIAKEILGYPGRRVSASKGQYQHDNENHIVVFNGNIVVPALGLDSMGATLNGYDKLWYGDIDVTLQEADLMQLSKRLGVPVYVLPEHAARFENESSPDVENYRFYTDGVFSKFYVEIERDTYGHPVLPPAPEKKELTYAEYVEKSKQYNLEQFTRVEGIEFDIQDMFDGVTRSNSPLHTFQEMCVVSGKMSAEDSLSVWMTEFDYTELRRLMGLWIRAYNPYSSEYRIEKDNAMMMAVYAPLSFSATPEWAGDGYLYKKIKENK